MTPRWFWILLPLLLTGCAGEIIREVNVPPNPGGCVNVESRTSWFNTQGALLCYNKQGQLVGMTGGPGAPMIQVPLVLIEAGGNILGGYFVGEGLKTLQKIDLEAAGAVTIEPVIPNIPEGLLQ